jgi:signal peptidase I
MMGTTKISVARRLGSTVKAWRGVLLFLVAMLVFRSAVADWMVVPSGSMNPTVIEGDRVLVNKHAYGWRVPFTLSRVAGVGEPQRGDVVILQSPDSDVVLLKRVVGLPGDVISLDNDQLTINGQKIGYETLPVNTGAELLSPVHALSPEFMLEKLPGKPHAVMTLPNLAARRFFQPVKIPGGQFLVMGDNRDNSHDSRYFGLVQRSAIYGKALRVVVSLDPEHAYLPRLDRIFSPAL